MPLYFRLLMEFSMEGEEYDLDFEKDFDEICKLIGRELKAAPCDKKPKKSLWDYVNKMYPLIVVEQSKGKSDETICRIIKKVSKREISPKTLQNYLSRIGSARKKQKDQKLTKKKNQKQSNGVAKDNRPKVTAKNLSEVNKPSLEAAIDNNGVFDLEAYLEQIPDDSQPRGVTEGVNKAEWIDGKWEEPEFNVIREKV